MKYIIFLASVAMIVLTFATIVSIFSTMSNRNKSILKESTGCFRKLSNGVLECHQCNLLALREQILICRILWCCEIQPRIFNQLHIREVARHCLHLETHRFIKIVIVFFRTTTMTSIPAASENYIFTICTKALMLCRVVIFKWFTVEK